MKASNEPMMVSNANVPTCASADMTSFSLKKNDSFLDRLERLRERFYVEDMLSRDTRLEYMVNIYIHKVLMCINCYVVCYATCMYLFISPLPCDVLTIYSSSQILSDSGGGILFGELRGHYIKGHRIPQLRFCDDGIGGATRWRSISHGAWWQSGQ